MGFGFCRKNDGTHFAGSEVSRSSRHTSSKSLMSHIVKSNMFRALADGAFPAHRKESTIEKRKGRREKYIYIFKERQGTRTFTRRIDDGLSLIFSAEAYGHSNYSVKP